VVIPARGEAHPKDASRIPPSPPFFISPACSLDRSARDSRERYRPRHVSNQLNETVGFPISTCSGVSRCQEECHLQDIKTSVQELSRTPSQITAKVNFEVVAKAPAAQPTEGIVGDGFKKLMHRRVQEAVAIVKEVKTIPWQNEDVWSIAPTIFIQLACA